jgi:hypothetical protein
MKLLINVLITSIFVDFTQMMKLLRRPSFSKMFPNCVYNSQTLRVTATLKPHIPLLASKEMQKVWQCNWTDLFKQQEKGRVICILESNGPSGNSKNKKLSGFLRKSILNFAVI